MSQNRFGRALRAARETAGLGSRELARAIDTDNSYICHLEKGRRIPTLHTLVRLADELGADAFALAKAAIQDLRAVG